MGHHTKWQICLSYMSQPENGALHLKDTQYFLSEKNLGVLQHLLRWNVKKLLFNWKLTLAAVQMNTANGIPLIS